MDEMSAVSCDAYRAVVRGDPRFIDLFQVGVWVGGRAGLWGACAVLCCAVLFCAVPCPTFGSS